MCSKMHKTRFIFILQKCSIICTHGSDYCYPSTSLDQNLNSEEEMVRDPPGWRIAPRFIPLLLEPVKPESRTRAVVRLQAERLPNRASSPLACQQHTPELWFTLSNGFKIVSKCLNVKTPDMMSITKLSFLCKRSWIVKTNPQVQYISL